MNPLELLDREKRIINGVHCREICGSPSEERWAKYRSIVGAKGRTLTQYQAYMLYSIRNWRVVCKDLGEPFRLEEDIFIVEAKLGKWLTKTMETRGLDAIGALMTLNNVEGRHIPALAQILLGKSISERSLYRIGELKGMPRFSLNQKYSKGQVQKYLNLIALS